MSESLFTITDLAKGRSNKEKENDAATLKTMLQAAINLELFTIPLYMYSMYSLTGMHQITGNKSKLYEGRWWPGIAPSFKKDPQIYEDLKRMPIDKAIWDKMDANYASKKLSTETNQTAFNLIFKVFIEEMFHVQLVSNLSKSLGVKEPSYTHPDLVSQRSSAEERSKSHGWTCYQGSIIPYIVDLKDTNSSEVEVKLGTLDKNQIELFKIIEMSDADAEKHIREDKREKYKVKVPFSGKYTKPSQLPKFGSIGNLYKSIIGYLDIEYADDQTLLDYMLKTNDAPYPQHDIFNNQRKGHPKAEYPGVNATLFGSEGRLTKDRVLNMINAITGQGEGGHITSNGDAAVPETDQSDIHALKANHRTYQDDGEQFNPPQSSHAYARSGMKMAHGASVGEMDHEEIFAKVEELMQKADFQTWDMWHAREGNKWTANMLQSDEFKKNKYIRTLPSADKVATAMNNLKRDHKEYKSDNQTPDPYDIMSQASAGSIKGVTTVLNNYWNSEGGSKVSFPSPSMGGSGDRLSICWALFGKGPNLKEGVLDRKGSNGGNPILNHACQGLAIEPTGEGGPSGGNNCADPSIYHTCKGSNLCKAEGGCGFVQAVGSHSNCGGKNLSNLEEGQLGADANGCGPSDKQFSPPGDNACGGQGGCAVPISASQLFPSIPGDEEAGFAYMPLFDFRIKGKEMEAFPSLLKDRQDTIPYGKGYRVDKTAWNAVSKMLKNRKEPVEIEELQPNDLRLALPPST